MIKKEYVKINDLIKKNKNCTLLINSNFDS